MGRFNNQSIGPEDRLPQDRQLTREGAVTITLWRPRIPQNTGSIARLCAATGSRLDLIEPFFEIDDRKLRRAGLDYWHLLDVRVFSSFERWLEKNPQITPWLIEVKGPKYYSTAQFQANDFLFFGDEQEGLAPELFQRWPNRHLALPQQGVRSLNLAMCAGIVTYEALRQLNWLGLR